MASGRLGASDLAATTNTTVYTVPASTLASINISVCNRNTTTKKIRLALATSGTPGAAEYIEYDQSIPAGGVLERTGIVLDAGKTVVAYGESTGFSVVVTGVEEAV